MTDLAATAIAGEGRGAGLGRTAPAVLPAADDARDVEDHRFRPDCGPEARPVGVAELGGEPVGSRRHVGRIRDGGSSEAVAERAAVQVEPPVTGRARVVTRARPRLVGEQRPAGDRDPHPQGVGDEVAQSRVGGVQRSNVDDPDRGRGLEVRRPSDRPGHGRGGRGHGQGHGHTSPPAHRRP
jgi:hypothetical protein